MARYVNLDILNGITIRLIRFFNSVSIEDDDEKEQLAEIIHDLADIPVTDIREEIRCKDCKFANPHHRDGMIFCTEFCSVFSENGFCDHAERGGE